MKCRKENLTSHEFIVNTIPEKATLSVKPDTNNTVAYGKYLITIARCVECHSKVDKGAVIAGTEFGVGREFDFPNGITCNSANIHLIKKRALVIGTKKFLYNDSNNTEILLIKQACGKNRFQYSYALAYVFGDDDKRPFFYLRIPANSKAS